MVSHDIEFCAEYGENTLFKFINAGEGKYYLYNVKSKKLGGSL